MDIPLKSLKFLSIDCQATGNNPKNSHLLEIGWLVFGADTVGKQLSQSPRTALLRPPQGFELPRHIKRLTGIRTAHFKSAVSDAWASAELHKQATDIARLNKMPLCLTVIHFARYEMAFLKHLFQSDGNSPPLPFDVLCTHQLASRLYPHLPRKGLRAMAGYLGHSMPTLKRCDNHLRATAFIWCRMMEKLSNEKNVHTLDQLHSWLKDTKVPVARKSYPMPLSARTGIPDSPGIYHMQRSNGDILYIGKAKSLKQRINSYFQNSRRHSENKLEMLTQAMDLEFIETPTALEAALLETDEIKKYRPPYNIALSSENRNLLFVSRDFGMSSATRDDHCRIGPVPSPSCFTAAHLLCRYFRKQPDSLDKSTLLDMPSSYCPDDDCFLAGLTNFKQIFGDFFRESTNAQAILQIGRLSWLKKVKSKVAQQNLDSEIQSEPIHQQAFVWTPEAVVRSLESICRRCGFLIRRARWMAILSESTIAWKIKDITRDSLNIIQLRGGRLSNRFEASAAQPIPPPINGGEPMVNRQVIMDLATFDRLRVLTTEMRRLLADSRLWCVKLEEERYLYPEQLRRLLSWL